MPRLIITVCQCWPWSECQDKRQNTYDEAEKAQREEDHQLLSAETVYKC